MFDRAEDSVHYKKHSLEIDMNPMVDLAFLLITFFMLTTTLSKPQVMNLAMPIPTEKHEKGLEQPVKESRVLTFLLGDNDEVFWYHGISEPKIKHAKFNSEKIKKLLDSKIEQANEIIVLIKPLETCRYENVVDILDEMKRNHIERYVLLDPEPHDLKLLENAKI